MCATVAVGGEPVAGSVSVSTVKVSVYVIVWPLSSIFAVKTPVPVVEIAPAPATAASWKPFRRAETFLLLSSRAVAANVNAASPATASTSANTTTWSLLMPLPFFRRNLGPRKIRRTDWRGRRGGPAARNSLERSRLRANAPPGDAHSITTAEPTRRIRSCDAGGNADEVQRSASQRVTPYALGRNLSQRLCG